MQTRTLITKRAAALATVLFASFLTGCGGGAGQTTPPTKNPTTNPTPVPVGGTPATPDPTTPSTTESDIRLNVAGTRGALPIEMGGAGNTKPVMVDANAVPFTPKNNEILNAPAAYGDRRFVKWQWNGLDIAGAATLTLPQSSIQGNGILTAVYTGRAIGAQGLTPNYSTPSFPHWDHFPVRVRFDRTTVAPAYDARIRTGLDNWIKATGAAVSYEITDDPAKTDIAIAFGPMPQGRLGYTTVEWDDTNAITKATMTLSDQLPGSVGAHNEFETIVAHEFGHALGLVGTEADAGHSSDPNDLMYSAPDPRRGVVTDRDLNTLTNLYATRLTAPGRRADAPAQRVAAGKTIVF